jgi:hypothetical protein
MHLREDEPATEAGSVRVTTDRLRMAQYGQTQAVIRPRGRALGQRAGSPLFVNLASDEMALLIEMVVDLGMN